MLDLVRTSTLALAASLALAAGPALAAPAPPKPSSARITLNQARALAVHARPGTIVAQELERESGGSGLRYTFEVKVGKAIYEVGVDAISGRILEKMREGPHPD